MACPCCRGAMAVIGHTSSERLDVIPAQFRVVVTRRPKLACRACEGVVVRAPAPARRIEGGLPTEALVAHVLVARYADHLPLYRQARIMTSWIPDSNLFQAGVLQPRPERSLAGTAGLRPVAFIRHHVWYLHDGDPSIVASWVLMQPCCMDLGCGRSYPSSGYGSGDANGERASQRQRHAPARGFVGGPVWGLPFGCTSTKHSVILPVARCLSNPGGFARHTVHPSTALSPRPA